MVDKKESKDSSKIIISRSDQLIKIEPLLDKIKGAAQGSNTITFVGSASGNSDNMPVTITWSQLHAEALAMSATLQHRGVKAGDHLALLGPTTRNLVTAIQAAWLAGASVSLLPIPLRFSSVEEFANQTRALMKHGDISFLLLDPDLAAYYEVKPGDPEVFALDELKSLSDQVKATDYKDVDYDPDRLAILQFTSGSTSDPKGVILTHRTLEANIAGMIEAAEVIEDDIFVSWLPLYHDMGLVGLLTVPMVIGCSLVLASPQDFLSKPADWMRWLHSFKGTVTSGPNFSWVLAARALRRLQNTGNILDLSAVRIALNGAEPIDPVVVEALVEAGEAHGFAPEAVFCAFGMAELSLGGTFPPPLRGMITDNVDRKLLEAEGVAKPVSSLSDDTRRFPLLGLPIPGLEMRVCDTTTGEPKGLREVGELEIRGTSVTKGYYKRPDLNKILFNNEWLRTGDMAYFVEGPAGGEPELVLCGRIKDVIIVSGRNLFPEDIERSVGTVEGVRAGNVIAFGVEGDKRKESVVVVAETKSEDYLEVRKKIRLQVIAVIGFPPRDTLLVQPGSLPKTSSGKLQRNLCRKQYMKNELKTIG